MQVSPGAGDLLVAEHKHLYSCCVVDVMMNTHTISKTDNYRSGMPLAP